MTLDDPSPTPTAEQVVAAQRAAEAAAAHAKRVSTTLYADLDVATWLREELRLGYCKALALPMDAVDGRPWVPAHDEAHPREMWADGTPDGCGHFACSLIDARA